MAATGIPQPTDLTGAASRLRVWLRRASLATFFFTSVSAGVDAQESELRHTSRRVGDDGSQISSQADTSSIPDLRGTAAFETMGSSFDRDRQRLFVELADDYALIDRLGNLVKRVSTIAKPSVIHIEARKTEKARGRTESFDEAGAGVLVNLNGEAWVMTNRHVIVGAAPQDILLRTSDGRETRPTRVIADASTDVAIMKVNAAVPSAKVGRSGDAEIGDFVLAIGSPFGLSHSVTFGILSAKGRRDLTLGTERIELQDFFQTDAAINPGNSGGPLLNLRGEVIAINTAIASSSGGSEGIGFAIPIDMAMRVANELVTYGRLRRAYLGVTLDPDFKAPESIRNLGYPGGALVKDVRKDSPAAAANLQRGDVILEFGGVSIDNDDHLVARVGLTAMGEDVPLIIIRDGRRYRTNVQVIPAPEVSSK